ncbi:hypothetical protein [Adhaeribacter terrigena]|uniref:hypothetical protein n=1 Tax=Adhaeribacter terrigena TaxID=2793070 RepID=UPI001909C479|nr:hypothetical protein [Adhaeribacter terrigena]
MKSKLIIVIFAFVAFAVVLSRGIKADDVLSWDKSGYYLYLPATIIYQDLTDYQFYRTKGKENNLTGGEENYGLRKLPNGKSLNKYPVGVAVMQLPFFLIAHGYASGSPDYLADGYVYPYIVAVVVSNIFWVVAGLIFLRSFLRIYFPENAVFLTLLAIAFGTNLYYYTAYDQGMSHPYSFFLFAAVLWLTEKYYNNFKLRHLLLLGLTLGLITITRPVNLLVILIPLFWKVHDLESLKARFLFLLNNSRKILLAGFLFFLVICIQLSYWKFVTGNWIYYSYENERFLFNDPEIINGLFSYKKGWFIYTPIAFLSFIGLIFLWKQYPKFIPALVLFFSLMIYVVFCWSMWFYGGSFGCRPLIETLPFVAIPLAAVCCYAFWVRNYFIKISLVTLIVLLVGLNLFQSYQYSINIIHWDSMTKEYYWRVFGKQEINHEELKQYLRN